MLGQYKQENARLRELLGLPLRRDEQKMVTQVISTVNDPYSDQVVIDKGSVNGVYEGQPVISDKGVVGQVVAVAKMTSRVLLICDATHALPIRVLRNDIRVIAAGNGCTDDLQLEHLPANTDIRVGDVLVTSGLGGRFPEGYPVGVVSSVKLDTQRAYTVIQARPTAGLQRLRYLLLLWGADRNGANPMTPEEVHRVANERLMQMMPQVLPAPDAMGPQMPAPATGLTPPQPSQPAGAIVASYRSGDAGLSGSRFLSRYCCKLCPAGGHQRFPAQLGIIDPAVLDPRVAAPGKRGDGFRDGGYS